jgi:hypothetical protein
MNFEDIGLATAYEAAYFVQCIEDAAVDEVGELCLTASHKLRSLAIMALVSKGDRTLFGQNLTRSGRVRLSYLDRLHREGIHDDFHSASGRIAGLLDALAASDLDLGRQIVGVSRGSLLSGAEYEDDFCYAQLIHRLVSEASDGVRVEPCIEQFEKVLDGEPSARLDVCRALLKGDQAAFDESFDGLILEREAKIADDKERCQLEEPEVMAERLIYIEGLAILRLATLHGLETQFEYRFCPSIARLTEGVAVPEE